MSTKAILTIIAAGAITSACFDSVEDAKAVLDRFEDALARCREYTNDESLNTFRFSSPEMECVIDLRRALGGHVVDADKAMQRNVDDGVDGLRRFCGLRDMAASIGMSDAFDEMYRRARI